MTLNDLTTLEQIDQFMSGSQACAYQVADTRAARYAWVQGTLIRFGYHSLNRRHKGILIRYLMKISGYSRQQLTRLIAAYVATGQVSPRRSVRHRFARRYNDDDIRLLAHLDQLHEAPCGAVVKKLCERAFEQGNTRYERLRLISISHIYNLRRHGTYRRHRRHFTKTAAKPSSIGERRQPTPQGQPGYLRVDSVHQGDQDKRKGVYYINLVDEVTQFAVVVASQKISERYLLPALSAAMSILPFKIRGFHSDNGSEYINKNVARMLAKLNIEMTKSRSRQTNDNALVEGKNAAIIRKHFGYAYIPQQCAQTINQTVQMPLYRYQNFHRPTFYPSTHTDAKGKQKKRYRYADIMTPCEKLQSLPGFEDYLKESVSADDLKQQARLLTDEQAAQALKEAKRQLFDHLLSASA